MNHIEPTTQTPQPTTPSPPATHHQPTPGTDKTRSPVLDGLILFALLGMCAGVYRIAGNTGFSVITGAVSALYGTWRLRR
ncbi:hypothetical protein ACIQXA_16015 [Streptomyces massasporeus]|uniref:hypothetical protein n=1 Tax=Streptomyces massasporeus TaxID=67324 RepID=UPI00382CE9CD